MSDFRIASRDKVAADAARCKPNRQFVNSWRPWSYRMDGANETESVDLTFRRKLPQRTVKRELCC